MQIFNTFKYGNDLVEILIEGANPYARQHLQAQEIDALRDMLPAHERIVAYAIGRAVGAGRAVWVITEQSLVSLVQGAKPGSQTWALSQLESFETLKGKYGYTLRAECAGQAISMYGADHSLSLLCHRAVAAHNHRAQFNGAGTLDAAQALQAIELITDAAMRIQPATMAGLTSDAGMMPVLNQVSRSGLIQNDELAAIFERMKAPQAA